MTLKNPDLHCKALEVVYRHDYSYSTNVESLREAGSVHAARKLP